jgi:ATP synthase F1 gamma subunit
MPSPDELKKEINSMVQLQNITQAFEQSAAAFIFKTRKKILEARPFIEQAWKCYNIVRSLAMPEKAIMAKKIVIAITPNQGMFGSLIWDVATKVDQLQTEGQYDLAVVGNKGKQHFSQNSTHIKFNFTLQDDFNYEDLFPIVEALLKYSSIVVIYPQYQSAFNQVVQAVELNADLKNKNPGVISDLKRYTLDPDIVTLHQHFSKSVLAIILYRYFVEALLAYKASQMIAMKRAYDNTTKRLVDVRFDYYRTYRSLIDNRIREISSARAVWEDLG